MSEGLFFIKWYAKKIAAIRSWLLAFTLLALITSCLDGFEDIKLDGSTQLVAPAAYGSFTLNELFTTFNKDSIIKTGKDSTLTLTFTQDTILNLLVNDIFDFPKNISMDEQIKEIGNTKIEDYQHYENVTLSEMVESLTNAETLDTLQDNTTNNFPKYTYDFAETPEYVIQYNFSGFDFFDRATLVTGTNEVKFTNNFPCGVKVTVEFLDANGSIGTMSFGHSLATGIPQNGTETQSINLAGKTVTTPLRYKILYLSFSGTTTPVYIQLSNDLVFDMNFKNLTASEGVYKIEGKTFEGSNESIPLVFNDKIKIYKAIVKSGNLTISARKSMIPNAQLSITIPSIQKNGTSLKHTFSISGTSTDTHTFDLSGTEIYLSDFQSISNTLLFGYSFTMSGTSQSAQIKATDNITFKYDLSKLAFSYIEGDFGNEELTLKNGNFNLMLDFWKKISGSMDTSDPKIRLRISNPLGIPALLNLDLLGRNRNGDTARLDAQPFVVEYPLNVNEVPKLSQKLLDKNNSNAVGFLGLTPNDGISYSAKININPYSQPTYAQPNFIVFDKYITVSADVEVPLSFTSNTLTYIDTISWSSATLDPIEEASLIFRTKNGIPLDVELFFTPVDSLTGTSYGSELFVTLLEAAITDVVGNAIGTTNVDNTLLLSRTDIENLNKANALRIRAEIKSPENGAKQAKLKPENTFDLKIIIDAKVKLN